MKKIWLLIKKSWHWILFILAGIWFYEKFKHKGNPLELDRLNHKTSKHLKELNTINKELNKIKKDKEKAREHIKNSSNKSVFNFIRKHANKSN